MANRKINNNVSTSAISGLEKVIIRALRVVSDFDAKIVKGSRANTSIVWRYFGALEQSRAGGKTFILDNNRLYCRYKYSLHRMKCMIRRLWLVLQLQCCRLTCLEIRLRVIHSFI